MNGVNLAYGYMLQGGLSEYAVIDQRILNGDDGNYLIPVQPGDRLCRERADRAVGLRHRGLRAEVSDRAQAGRHRVDRRRARPQAADGRATRSARASTRTRIRRRLLLTDVPAAFEAWLRERAAARWASRCVAVADPATSRPMSTVDDIVLLAARRRS